MRIFFVFTLTKTEPKLASIPNYEVQHWSVKLDYIVLYS